MKRTDAVIVGGGPAGLAVSRCLSDRGIEHVVLERGRLAERWRSERWDSLRLLTPNWQSRLPGFRYEGLDPDGFMTVPELLDFFERYARAFAAPVETGTTVLDVEHHGKGYRVATDRGVWLASNVVIATGHCNVPYVPKLARALSRDVRQLVPGQYRNPDQLEPAGVLVVGASASGVQLAEEIHRSGRPVALSVGHHVRLPRRYRGRDIMRWLDAAGILDERAEKAYDLAAARRQPSLQLAGRASALDLGTLQDAGVCLAGRLVAVDGDRIELDDSLEALALKADAKLTRLLHRIDAYIEREGLRHEVDPAEPLMPIRVPAGPQALFLRRQAVRTVIWATGFRRTYPWLRVPILDDRGEIRHRGGITQAPGLYVVGLSFLRRRKSTFIDGVGEDARELVEHLTARLARRHAVA